ncbi:hypothetical protein M1534_03075 [Patescibacteria group bacterium]|jgi:hypothetical protein|nr:hypothetical protein [Patescibacteria group bacterium]
MKQKALYPSSHPSKREKVSITKKSSTERREMRWAMIEEQETERRIIKLRDDQIIALFFCVGISFFTQDIPDILQDIHTTGEGSIYFGTLLDEADSKENLLWWIDFFEQHNK